MNVEEYKALMEKASDKASDQAKEAVLDKLMEKDCLDIMATPDFVEYMTSSCDSTVQRNLPYVFAQIIKRSDLELCCDYVLLPSNGYYDQYKEADSLAELYDLADCDNMLDELDATDLKEIADKYLN